MTAKSKTYDYLLILCIALVALGGVGGSFQPLRMLFILLFPILFYESIQKQKTEPFFYGYDKVFFGLWLLYAVISLHWSLVPSESVKGVAYLLIYIVGFFEMLWLGMKSEDAHKAVCAGWILAFVLTVPIASWELLTDNHLSFAFQEAGKVMNYGNGYVVDRRFASIAFGNLNGYNTFLSLVLPFVLIALLHSEGKRKGLLWVVLALLAIIIVVNSSRAAMLTLAAGFCLYLGCIVLNKGVRAWLVSVLATVAAVSAVCLYMPNIYESMVARFVEQGFTDEYRSELLRCGWDALKNSAFMGIGVENFIPLMEHHYLLEILPPHNLWMEIAVQFGVIVFALFAGLLVRQWAFSRKGTAFNRQAFWFCMVLLIPISVINSGYLTQSFTWVFLASLCILSNPKYNPIHDRPV